MPAKRISATLAVAALLAVGVLYNGHAGLGSNAAVHGRDVEHAADRGAHPDGRHRRSVTSVRFRAMSVAGKTAIVTGAATGIGAATATLLAARGARVLAAGLQPDELRETVAAIEADGGEAVAIEADVSDPEPDRGGRRARPGGVRRRRHPRQ